MKRLSTIRINWSALGEDVLLLIFWFLSGEDICNCEAVCRKLRDILLTERPWKIYI